MSDEPATYLQTCSMSLNQVARVHQMAHDKFPNIKMTINEDRGTYSPLQAKQIPEGEVLVIFRIPKEGVYMPEFYKEFFRVLNPESVVAIQKEREGIE